MRRQPADQEGRRRVPAAGMANFSACFEKSQPPDGHLPPVLQHFGITEPNGYIINNLRTSFILEG